MICRNCKLPFDGYVSYCPKCRAEQDVKARAWNRGHVPHAERMQKKYKARLARVAERSRKP